MELQEWQRRVAAFAAEQGIELEPGTRLLDLTSELGELCKVHLKATAYGHRPFQADEAWREEIGDLFFALLLLAESSYIDLETALHRVLAKYRTRAREKGEIGSGR